MKDGSYLLDASHRHTVYTSFFFVAFLLLMFLECTQYKMMETMSRNMTMMMIMTTTTTAAAAATATLPVDDRNQKLARLLKGDSISKEGLVALNANRPEGDGQ